VDPHSHDAQMAHLDRINARLDQIQARQEARLPLDPQHYETTIAQVRRMVERERHPTWIQAAYADLAGRLARVEDLLEELGASMSLLHSKMETIIGQLAVYERQDRSE
jgi:hypothetical protein